LKALEQEYVGKVKCVFIDPPYNTSSAFEHYVVLNPVRAGMVKNVQE